MVGLLDVAKATETVAIRGKDVDVYGVSAEGAVSLWLRFPEIRKYFSGVDSNITTEGIMKLGLKVGAAIIAAGCGDPGSKKHEEAASRFTLGDQAALVEAILRLTFPFGVERFMEQISLLAETASQGGPVGVMLDTNSPEPSND